MSVGLSEDEAKRVDTAPITIRVTCENCGSYCLHKCELVRVSGIDSVVKTTCQRCKHEVTK